MSRLLAVLAARWGLLTLAALAVVTVASLWPTTRLQDATPGGDKLHHLFAYAAIAFPVALARPRLWGGVLVGLAAWSGGIELLQPLAGRSTDGGDLLANLLGLSIGVVLAAFLRRFAA